MEAPFAGLEQSYVVGSDLQDLGDFALGHSQFQARRRK
jgi:hypothetical protein